MLSHPAFILFLNLDYYSFCNLNFCTLPLFSKTKLFPVARRVLLLLLIVKAVSKRVPGASCSYNYKYKNQKNKTKNKTKNQVKTKPLQPCHFSITALADWANWAIGQWGYGAFLFGIAP
jgi:hypothetical protein